jgi:endonuclease YncB( thermonuclease family)
MMKQPTAAALVLAATVAAAGCTTSTTKPLYFAAEEMERLDGLQPGDTIALETTAGHVVEITSNTTLRFKEGDGPPYKLRCETVDIIGSLFACANGPGTERRIDLARTKAFILIRKSKTSWGKTLLVIIGVYAVLGTVAAATS